MVIVLLVLVSILLVVSHDAGETLDVSMSLHLANLEIQPHKQNCGKSWNAAGLESNRFFGLSELQN